MVRGGVMEALDLWRSGAGAPPEEVQIYPTNNCNLRCVFCITPTGFYRGQREVPTQRWLDVAEELCEMGVGRVLISGGGEPLLSPATLPMMALFKKAGLYGRMICNGTAWCDSAIRETVAMGWDQIAFSIDGPNAEIHDGLRGVAGCFDKSRATIRRFLELKAELGSAAPRLEINMVMNKRNYLSVREMVRLAGELGIAHLNVEPVCNNSPAVEAMRLSESDRRALMVDLLPEAQACAEQAGLSTNFNGLMAVERVEKAGQMRDFIIGQLRPERPASRFEELACYEPWLWPKIEANGDVWPCSTIPLKENILGESFEDIWFGPAFNAYRQRIMSRDLPESCQNCVVSHMHTNSELRALMKSPKGEESR